MVLIRNANFPGAVPLIVPERKAPPPPKPKGENRNPDPVFLELANEIVRTCRACGVAVSMFERDVNYNTLIVRIKQGCRLKPETEQRIRLALRRLEKRKRL